MRSKIFTVLAASTLSVAFAAGCSSHDTGMGSGGAGSDALPPVTDSEAMRTPQIAERSLVGKYIKHVVIIVQENRTFDNIFAGYPNADAPLTGKMIVPSTAKQPQPTVTTQPLHQINFNECQIVFKEFGCDLGHSWGNSLTDYDHGNMDGFSLPYLSNAQQTGTYAYAYLQRSQVQPYWTMANQYVLADHMFPTQFGESFTGHLFLVSSTDNVEANEAVTDTPDNPKWGCAGGPSTTVPTITLNAGKIDYKSAGAGQPIACFSQWNTLADTLDAAGISWKYYSPALGSSDGSGGMWSIFDAIKSVCGPAGGVAGNCEGSDWKNNVLSPQTRALTAPTGKAFPSVAWVIPDYADSDHSENGSDTGPSWVAGVINQIGKSAYWNSTAIFVVWDDFGGWYDDAPPPQRDFRGLGIRVPFLIVSPYAKKGYVSHTIYEFGSVVRFVNEAFGLEPLGKTKLGTGYTDTRAASLDDSFDFTQKPRAFKAIPAKYPLAHFLHEKPSLRAPDED